jgi:protein-S-isoprenylcysteine O-methyltransferase Ste14
MNAPLPQFLKAVYKKEPITSFLLIIGATDIALGGFEGQWTLLSFGLIIVLTAAGLRWWQIQKAQAVSVKQTPKYVLPPSSSRPPLPLLTSEKRQR